MNPVPSASAFQSNTYESNNYDTGAFTAKLGMSLKDSISMASSRDNVPVASHHQSVMSSNLNREDDLLSQTSAAQSNMPSNIDTISVS